MATTSDRTKWHLHVEEGRQRWIYDENDTSDQSFVEQYHLGMIADAPEFGKSNREVTQSLKEGIAFLQKLQCEDGHWANDYGGPMFLLPGLVIVCHITGVELQEQQKQEIIYYLQSTQHNDGGWGLHIESQSTMFGSALSYVVLRLLGVSKDEPITTKARQWILNNGGAVGIPSWGKFWLAALGVYSFLGLNPIPPDFWLLPYWMPVHPARWWCHCRMVYLPMSYIYGGKRTGKITPLILNIRKELYLTDYNKIDWPSMRNTVAPMDLQTPHSWIVNSVHYILDWYEYYCPTFIREMAEKEAITQITLEDENTNYIDIGPVNKVLNMLCVWFAENQDSSSPKFQKHVDRINDYLWLAKDGMKMQGYNGSQLWDTAFTCQAILAAKDATLFQKFDNCLKQACKFIDITQVRKEVTNLSKSYRHQSVGAWPFSTRHHGWPISDCTAEGLKSMLLFKKFGLLDTNFTKDRFQQAVDVILSLQNNSIFSNGGWSTYEFQRGSSLLEQLNPSETFHGIMVDYPYVECTSDCVTALYYFKEQFPSYKQAEIDNAITKGIRFILDQQLADGSWRGCWAVCFTYGTWFAMKALTLFANSSTYGKECALAISKGIRFLLSMQNADGGWGEAFQSCVDGKYIQHPDGSQVVNTAWAALSLLSANSDRKPIDSAIQYLQSKQLTNGNWKQEGISGVFNATCAISYSGYKNIFPIWALAEYSAKYDT